MATLNPESPEYTPVFISNYPPRPTTIIHRHCPAAAAAAIALSPQPYIYPIITTPYYYYHYTTTHLLPPPLPPAVPPHHGSFISVTHKRAIAGPAAATPARRSETTAIVGFVPKRNTAISESSPVIRRSRSSQTSADQKNQSPSGGRELFQKRLLGKHHVIPLRYFQRKTSVMIKNIPYNYTREMVVEFLDKHCALENEKANRASYNNGDAMKHFAVSAYDFLYLPMDFKENKSKGYAFVNFTHHKAVWRFFHTFHSKTDVFLGSTKSVTVVSAKIQGKEAQVRSFESTMFECESEEFLPVWFSPARDGSGRAVKLVTVGKCGKNVTTTQPSLNYI